MTAGAAASPDDRDLRRESERICQLIDDLGALGGAPVRARAEELVQRLVHLYGTGLANLIAILGPERLDDDVRARLLADPLVSSLLVLHGVHPEPGAAESFDPDAAAPAVGADERLVRINLARKRGPETAETK